jgi:hypothetical protein
VVDYRLFYLNPKGRVCEAQVLSCADDAEAIKTFDAYSSDRPMQLWHRDRRIMTYWPPADPRTSRCGLYRIKSPPPDENDVMVEGGSDGLLAETLYRELRYRPPFEELPWADEYFS